MDNIELEQKIKELIMIENYFDLIEKVKEFEKEYKNSDFYRNTKMPLDKVIREARIHYALNFVGVGNQLQKVINNLDISHLNELLDQIGETFGRENQEINEQLEVIKDLKY